MSRRATLYALLVIAAAARLLMQMAAMPPYAGLDEAYHVARLAFVRAEHRNPSSAEPSQPTYIVRSIAEDPSAPPALCAVAERWPTVVRARPVLIDQPIAVHPYIARNYEAQQPSLYYSMFAPIVPPKSALFELRVWRLISVAFGLLIVVGTAIIGERWWGPAGMLAGALVVSLPTWMTLVVRASNDALACAAVAIAIAATVTQKTIVEAIAWAIAIAAKLYTWPMLVLLPFLWRGQRASRARVFIVIAGCAVAMALTIADLAVRTSNPLGLFAFDRSVSATHAAIHYLDVFKIVIATLVWTSGPHWDALTLSGVILYLAPVALLILPALRRNDAAVAGLIAFGLAQLIYAGGYARTAHGGLPAAGKEGWYWYALVPILVPAFLAPAAARFRALAWWIVGWDIMITEVALFHDYSGASSPAHPTALFRWGPWHWPFTAHLDGIGVGPFVGAIVLLRIIHVTAFFALESLSRIDDRPHALALSNS